MPAFRPDRIIIHPDVHSVYDQIEASAARGRKFETALWKSFLRAKDRVRSDGQWGEVIRRIPLDFVRRYGVTNLYCVDLAFFHRAFYTIFGRDVIFLDLVDHDRYSKWFPGRRR